jgi:hypothetical protein
MSEYTGDGEPIVVHRMVWRRARKSHKCAACKETIEIGHRYTITSVVWDRTAESIKRCAKCETIHQHLRQLCRGSKEELYPAERLDCGLKYEDEWGPLPDEIAALAFMSQDEAQRLAPGAGEEG